MRFNIGIFEENISRAFSSIMSDYQTSQKGMRRYRIYIYIYIFGCIHENDMQYVFPEDYESENKSGKELLNVHRSALNFLSRKDDLKKLKDGYFTIERSGVEDLYNYLLDNDLITGEMEFSSFFRKYRAPKTLLSHSSKTGRVVLSFVRMYGAHFLREPIINSKGYIDVSLPGTAYNNFIVPDALLFYNDDDENIYIEADSSQERINSKIVPKLENYISFILSKESEDSSSTIHFSLWNTADDKPLFFDYKFDFDKIITFYDFISKNIRPDITFSDYISLIIGYDGTFEPAKELFNILSKYGIKEASSISDLKEAILYYYNRYYYGKDFVSRSNSIFGCSKKVKQLNNLLLNGTRFVCTSLNSYDNSYKFIYLEKSVSSLIKYLNGFIPVNFSFVEYKKIHCFKDEKTGFNICFRNVFIYEYNGKYKYISFENISNDISGLIRSKYYAYSYQIPSIGDFSLFCIYNEYLNINPKELFERSSRLSEAINFISYKELSLYL